MSIKSLDELFNNLTPDINNIIKLLLNYNNDDWKEYINKFNQDDFNDNSYHKLLINKNQDFEMFLIMWNPLSNTLIHDHPSKGCIVKVLDGKLYEELYHNNENNDIKFLKGNIIEEKHISNRVGNIILHKIINYYNRSYSLHIYLPPNYKQKQYFI